MSTHVLLVEDSPGDVRLTREALQAVRSDVDIQVATDGVEAMAFLMRDGGQTDAAPPDLILLDLDLRRMDWRQVLAHVKDNMRLEAIPTMVLTASDAEADITASYQLRANAYLNKPVRMDAYASRVETTSEFWLTQVELPKRPKR